MGYVIEIDCSNDKKFIVAGIDCTGCNKAEWW